MKKYDVYDARLYGVKMFSADIKELESLFGLHINNIRRAISCGSIIGNEYNIVDPTKNIQKRLITEYIVLDLLDNERTLFIGSKNEIVDYLNINRQTFDNVVTYGRVYNKRYLIEKLEVDDEDV